MRQSFSLLFIRFQFYCILFVLYTHTHPKTDVPNLSVYKELIAAKSFSLSPLLLEKMMLLESILENSDCFRLDLQLLILNIVMAVFNGVLAAIAFSQVCYDYLITFFCILLVFSSSVKHFII
ncbi:hypothetical protein RchiOBHm_Chr1g0371851 [Rosa chinensis]|uniref:Uncharacterized protein n=1 Tax=Rosa chinensis TaxID=74649 RepID=A0A2P6SLQ7_ROSCH|nr:hypothetical protein RchiOBHm_Chr1g0371851 [Rosa chinensis]